MTDNDGKVSSKKSDIKGLTPINKYYGKDANMDLYNLPPIDLAMSDQDFDFLEY